MFKVVLAAVCLAVVLADHHEECGPLEKILFKHQWASIYGVTNHREELATAVWKEFFHRHEDEVKRFERVHGDNLYSGDFRAHMMRVFAGLDLLISAIDDEAVFEQALKHYTELHVKLEVNSDIVKEFGKALGFVVPQFLHERLAVEAWRPCFKVIAQGISKAE